MRTARKNLIEGSSTALVGLALVLFGDGVGIPVFTLTKVGVVMLAVGGVMVLVGLVRSSRGSARS
ncbi:DUF5708 family protein [Streptomyces sp. NPDC006798]|uniref:DUF5708 family protein n=1 Tax=Streptomyces sp. NPDC006798 TaxID=3155462 RepID=UPI0033D621CC